MTKTPKNAPILVIAPADGRGGIASVLRLHAQTEVWHTKGCQLLSTYDDRSSQRKIVSALKAYCVAPIAIYRAGIVHVHLAAQKSVFRKLPLILLAKLFRKPIIVHVHAFSVESLFDSTALSAGKWALRLADRVVALSQTWADAINARDRALKVSVIPNPVSASPTKVRPIGREPVILFAGKLEQRKGYQDLLAAAALVLRSYPAAQFWFAGHGDIAIAAKMAETLGVSGSVRFMGWLDVDAMSSAYEDATIFCLPSYNEGVPMVVLEAMGRGLPVVCTKVGGLPDYIEHDRNGAFAVAGDPVSIAESLLHLLDDPAKSNMMGEEAAKTIHATCSLDAISQQLDQLYEEISRNQSRAAGTRHHSDATGIASREAVNHLES
jgi:glycosyltransferase involved in cell wall biosynthesis